MKSVFFLSAVRTGVGGRRDAYSPQVRGKTLTSIEIGCVGSSVFIDGVGAKTSGSNGVFNSEAVDGHPGRVGVRYGAIFSPVAHHLCHRSGFGGPA